MKKLFWALASCFCVVGTQQAIAATTMKPRCPSVSSIQSIGVNEAILVGVHGTPGSWKVMRKANKFDTTALWTFFIGVGPAKDANEAIDQATVFIHHMLLDHVDPYPHSDGTCRYVVLHRDSSGYASAIPASAS